MWQSRTRAENSSQVESKFACQSFLIHQLPICLQTGKWKKKKVNDALDISWIDWLEFILRDLEGCFFLHASTRKSYVKHVPESLLPSVVLRPLFLRPTIAIDFQFQSRAFSGCDNIVYELRAPQTLGCSRRILTIFHVSIFPSIFLKLPKKREMKFGFCKHHLKWRRLVVNWMHDVSHTWQPQQQ